MVLSYPNTDSCLTNAHRWTDLGYNSQVFADRFHSTLPESYCRKSDHFRPIHAMLNCGQRAGISELPDIRSVHCGANSGINGTRSSISCVILNPRTQHCSEIFSSVLQCRITFTIGAPPRFEALVLEAHKVMPEFRAGVNYRAEGAKNSSYH